MFGCVYISEYVKDISSNFSTSYQIPAWFDQKALETHKNLLFSQST